MSKKSITHLLLSCILCSSLHTAQASESDTILYGAEQRIYSAFLLSLQEGNPDTLVSLEDAFAASPSSTIRNYWIAYTGYHKSLFHLKKGNREDSYTAIVTALNTIDTIKDKNSELYALTAFLQGYSLQFARGSSPDLFSEIRHNAEKALELDSNNIRALYIMGINDMYQPVAFGGGKMCEEYFLKAIALPEPPQHDKTAPVWGKCETYSALVGYYIKNQSFDKAKRYLSEGLVLYPDDYMLNQQKGMLKDK